MDDLEKLTAAYMAACKDRPADWNEIGYWYFRQAWDAAAIFERERCAKAFAYSLQPTSAVYLPTKEK